MSNTPRDDEHRPGDDETRIFPAVGDDAAGAPPGDTPGGTQPTQPQPGPQPQYRRPDLPQPGQPDEEYYDEFVDESPTTVFPPVPAGQPTAAYGPATHGAPGAHSPGEAAAGRVSTNIGGAQPRQASGGATVLFVLLIVMILCAVGALLWLLGVFSDSEEPTPTQMTVPEISTVTVPTSTQKPTSSAPATSSSTKPSTSSAQPSSSASSSSKPTSSSAKSSSSTAPSSSAAAPTSTSEPRPVAEPPSGAKKCGTGGGFTAYTTTDTTSCPFAINTANAAAELKDNGGTVTVASPVTGQDYEMSCVAVAPGRLDCAGGTNARITLIY
ncbi:hypothetical protein [Corynebacterium aquilae]|uniref:hypothetical protein n=1 Tax=Corynebacterium aquilae TaxID=203263 RepID=UPI0009519648|nr:hypothetical protein [Corynebacterium aquilae]